MQQKNGRMKQDDLRRFFANMLKDYGYLPSESMRVMGRLIRLTIAYRDQWKANHDEILTVAEARKAVEIYNSVLESESFPEELDEKIAGLVRLWLKEINRKFY
ncbi:MAG: hypothetical protein JSV44_08750 [Candidatus Zixiibacteriota bacterium]|nr:MAG: hypothetical protein JSV44_08750 [candidate division Zixibacteria bacterium]